MKTMERRRTAGCDHDTTGADSRMARVSEIAEMMGSITDAQVEQIKGVVIGMRLANAGKKQA